MSFRGQFARPARDLLVSVAGGPDAPADADYIQATFDRLMAMMAEQAAAHGARYPDAQRRPRPLRA